MPQLLTAYTVFTEDLGPSNQTGQLTTVYYLTAFKISSWALQAPALIHTQTDTQIHTMHMTQIKINL